MGIHFWEKTIPIRNQHQNLVGTLHPLLGRREQNRLGAIFVVAAHPDAE